MQPQRFLRLADVLQTTGLKRSTLYTRIKAGTFPQQIKLGGPHASAWLSTEIDAWMQSCIEASRGGTQVSP